MTLSPEDLTHARATLRWTKFFQFRNLEHTLNVTALELAVENFTTTTIKGMPDKVAWSAQVLWSLSDGAFDGAESGHFTSMDELRAAFEAAAKEAQEDHEWSLANDARYADYRSRCSRTDQHVWGDDEMDACRCWLNESDYQVWVLHYMVEEDALDALRDSLLGMATTATRGENVADAAAKSLTKHVEALVERYAEGREKAA
jgi:hypothetical protein